MAGPYPLSFLAAILNMIAGLVDVSMCAACRLEAGTMHCALLPQKTRTKASWLGEEDTVLVGPEISEDFTFKTINFLVERGWVSIPIIFPFFFGFWTTLCQALFF